MNYPKIITLLVFSVTLLSAAKLQLLGGSFYFKQSSENTLNKRAIVAERGLITDRNGLIVAQSIPSYRLVVNALNDDFGKDIDSLIVPLSQILEVEASFLEEKISTAVNSGKKEKFVLASGLNNDEMILIKSLIKDKQYLFFEYQPVRHYPFAHVFSHILGYTGEVSATEFKSGDFDNYLLGEFTGKEGLEKYYEKELRGENGLEVVESDSFGNQQRILSSKQPIRGGTVTLTIDSSMQHFAYNLLAEKEIVGSILVTNITNGDILTAVNYPSYDNNVFVVGDSNLLASYMVNNERPLLNRFLSGLYPCGSVFKIVIATAALSEGVVRESTIINAPGQISVGSFNFKDWKASGHGDINIVSALAKSADTFFYQIGGGFDSLKGLGVEKIVYWAEKFNFGRLTEINLPGEMRGLVPDPLWKEKEKGEPWYIGNTYHLSIGQGDLLATPLQVNQMAAISATGKIYKPNLVKGENELQGYLDVDGSYLQTVQRGLVAACSPGGTAYPFFKYSGEVACKTGTSETGVGDNTHAWFTMYFPANNPQYAMTVFLENGGAGSDDAAPLALKLYEYMLSNNYND